MVAGIKRRMKILKGNDRLISLQTLIQNRLHENIEKNGTNSHPNASFELWINRDKTCRQKVRWTNERKFQWERSKSMGANFDVD
jgi:hypothetical protein